MLRFRHCAGQSLRLAQLSRVSAYSLEQSFVQRRTFATESDSNGNDPAPTPLSSADVEARLKDLANLAADTQAEAKVTRRREKTLRASLRRDATIVSDSITKKPSSKRPPPKKHNAAQDSTPNSSVSLEETEGFNEALDVVRKVYGVKTDQASKKKRKKKKADPPTSATEIDGFELETGEPSISSEIDPLGPSFTEFPSTHSPTQTAENLGKGIGVGIFSSMEDMLKEQPKPKRGKRAPKSVEEPSPSPSTRKARTATKPSPKLVDGMPKKWKNRELDVKRITPRRFGLKAVEDDKPLDVPKLAHNLDRVLFNSGVYDLQDKRSRVYNFDPYLATIMPVQEFNFEALSDYITSSKDSKLRDLCKKHEKKYCGSTSSMTAILSQFHFLLSAWRKPKFSNLSRELEIEFENFTKITRAPAAAFAHLKDGVYAIDADKQFDTENVLSMLGKSMEKLLTLPKEEFEKYRRTRSHQLSGEEKNAEEAYHYTMFGDFMMRSQLDAYDPRLPGTGIFDLKTRAVVPIRMDALGYEKGVGYEIRYRTGLWESFEREYYDMVRSTLLKYSLQVRMGRMDGIFVAFHNTQRIFGFQYVPLTDMDFALHGTHSKVVGDDEFKASLHILNDLLDRASTRFPDRSLRLHVETRETNPPLMYFFVEPVDDGEIAKIQASGKESVEEAKSDILDLAQRESEAEESRLNEDSDEADRIEEETVQEETIQEELSDNHQRQTAWDEMMSKVDETVEDDSKGLQTVRDAIHEALTQSGLLRGKSDTEKESYLNALVDALAAELPGAKDSNESGDTQTAIEQCSIEKGDEVIAQKTEQSNETMDATVDAEDSIAKTAESVNESANTTDNNVPEASLTDLILKFAQHAENKSENLGIFEQVLSKLAAEAHQAEKDSNAETVEPTEEKSVDQNAEEITAQILSGFDPQTATAEAETDKLSEGKELLGMVLTIQNKFKGTPITRVTNNPSEEYKSTPPQVEYLVTELQPEKARKVYQQIKSRRKTAFYTDPEEKNKQWYKMWGGKLAQKVNKGKEYRQRQDKEDLERGLKVAWDEKPIAADSIHPTDPDVGKQ